MKTRIKIVKSINGTTAYTPQRESYVFFKILALVLLIWNAFLATQGIGFYEYMVVVLLQVMLFLFIAGLIDPFWPNIGTEVFKTEDEAKQKIDDYLKSNKKQEITYIKYP